MHQLNEDVKIMLNEILEKLGKWNSPEKMKGTTNDHFENTKSGDIHNEKGEISLESSRVSRVMSQIAREMTDNDIEEWKNKAWHQKWKKFCFKDFDDSLEKVFNDYETEENNAQLMKSVYVQTMRQHETTTDKQSQCDLSLGKNSSTDIPCKQMKLKDCCSWSCVGGDSRKFGNCGVNQLEDIKTKNFHSAKKTHRLKTSRIRIGLSKRVRPPPLHISN